MWRDGAGGTGSRRKRSRGRAASGLKWKRDQTGIVHYGRIHVKVLSFGQTFEMVGRGSDPCDVRCEGPAHAENAETRRTSHQDGKTSNESGLYLGTTSGCHGKLPTHRPGS